MSQALRVLHISDRPSGFAADTLRGLESRCGLEVLTLDIRAFSSQGIYDPVGFRELDRQEWLGQYDPNALQRFQWADVLFVESSNYALSWVSRAGFDRPVLARVALDDCDRPGLFLVDWGKVSHLAFPDALSRDRFEAVLPGLTSLSRSVIPLHLDENRSVSAAPTSTAIWVAGDPLTEPGAITGLAIQDRLAAMGRMIELGMEPVSAAGMSPAARTATLIAQRAAKPAAQPRIEPVLPAETAAGFVLCATGSLAAAGAALVHAAAGSRPVLRAGRTCAQDWFEGLALVYDDPVDAADGVLGALCGPSASDRRDAIQARVREVCGTPALEALALQIRSTARRSRSGLAGSISTRALSRLTVLTHNAIHLTNGALRRLLKAVGRLAR